MIEKAMASGINANATTIPARVSPLTLENQVCLMDSYMLLPSRWL
ncbi:hypothetical protein Q427_29630 [Halomonas sp. BC04]|nr:hypothetical protein Q427_29630 [Halomonas sp. BC04]